MISTVDIEHLAESIIILYVCSVIWILIQIYLQRLIWMESIYMESILSKLGFSVKKQANEAPTAVFPWGGVLTAN